MGPTPYGCHGHCRTRKPLKPDRPYGPYELSRPTDLLDHMILLNPMSPIGPIGTRSPMSLMEPVSSVSPMGSPSPVIFTSRMGPLSPRGPTSPVEDAPSSQALHTLWTPRA